MNGARSKEKKSSKKKINKAYLSGPIPGNLCGKACLGYLYPMAERQLIAVVAILNEGSSSLIQFDTTDHQFPEQIVSLLQF